MAIRPGVAPQQEFLGEGDASCLEDGYIEILWLKGLGGGGEEGRNQRSQSSAHGLRWKSCHLDGKRGLQPVGRLVALFQSLSFLRKPQVFQLDQATRRLHLIHRE